MSLGSKQVELEIVGAHDSFLASRVQRVNTTADQAVNTIDELGNPLHAGTSKDVPNVTLTFQAMDAGIKVVGALAGVSTSGWVAGSGVNVATSLDRSVDAIIRIRDENVAQYVKAAHFLLWLARKYGDESIQRINSFIHHKSDRARRQIQPIFREIFEKEYEDLIREYESADDPICRR